MTIFYFLDWVQEKYQLPNMTSAVKKAAEVMRVGERTVWQWRNGERKVSQSMLLLMELIIRYY